MSQVDELVEKLSSAIAVSVKKAMEDSKTPTVEDRLDELTAAIAELAGTNSTGADASAAAGTPTVKAADIASAFTEIKESQESVIKAVDALVDRIANLEKGTAISKAAAGQDTDTKKAAGSAIDAVLVQLGQASRNGKAGAVTLN